MSFFLQRPAPRLVRARHAAQTEDRKSTRLNSSHRCISYAVFCLKKKKTSVLLTLPPQEALRYVSLAQGFPAGAALADSRRQCYQRQTAGRPLGHTDE